jgi:hypothetical protein
MLLRLAGDGDRRPCASEGHAIRPDRVLPTDCQPPLLTRSLQADDLTGNDFYLGSLSDFTQVGSPLPVRRPQAAAVDPVGIGIVRDQVALPAVYGHRRSDGGRGRTPAIGVGKADVLLRRRSQRQPTAGEPLPPGPVSGDVAPVHEYDPRGIQASSRQRPGLGSDGDALGPGSYNCQRRHDGEDSRTHRAR